MKTEFYHITITVLLAILFVSHAEAQSSDKLEFTCLKDFTSDLQSNQTLLIAGVDVIKLENGERYLLALGTTTNLAKETPGAASKIETKQVAEAKARRLAAEFYQADVKTDTKLTQLRTSDTVINNDGIKQEISSIIKTREEIIEERATIILAGSKIVATWLSDGGDTFNVVIAIQIKS